MKLKHKTREAGRAIFFGVVILGLYVLLSDTTYADTTGILGRFLFFLQALAPGIFLLLIAYSFVHFYYLPKSSKLITFSDYGMKKLHASLLPQDQKKILTKAKKIRVLKTWFPDHPNIREGVLEALEQNNAKLILLLCNPFSKILSQRSCGANELKHHGRDAIINSVDLIRQRIQAGKGSIELKLYDEWPGVPLIWCDRRLFMGFYLRGKSSPFWPWIEIKVPSECNEDLEKQFEELWEKAGAIYSTPEDLQSLVDGWKKRLIPEDKVPNPG